MKALGYVAVVAAMYIVPLVLVTFLTGGYIVGDKMAEAQTGQFRVNRGNARIMNVKTPVTWKFEMLEAGPTNSAGRYSVNVTMKDALTGKTHTIYIDDPHNMPTSMIKIDGVVQTPEEGGR